jgi:valyl-tRNA synthetase|tara:strand:+ start:2039 stop:2443 length:405 start_codon:yes stop_codon:yes gene_type:complete
MKKKYKVLKLLKKIKKSNLYSNLGTLNNEKKKLSKINQDLQELLNGTNVKIGDVLSSSELKGNSFFKKNLNEKIEISKNREIHIDKEISGYVKQISKIKKQQEIIEKKISDDFVYKQKENELKNSQNYRIKSFL